MANPQNIIGTTLGDTFIGSSNQQIFDTKGRLYQGGKPVFSSDGNSFGYKNLENITVSTGMALSPSTITNHGISVLASSGVIPTSGVGRVYLAAPSIGVEKTIILKSTAAGWLLDIDISTNCTLNGTSAQFIGFSSLGTGLQAVNLIGLSTSEWGVKSVSSTVGQFNAANGIRALTAVRTT